jgi:hypothetical protein
MKNQRDKLQQYQKRITIVSERETEVARECLRRGDKKKALVALRRKKYQESLLENTDKQLAQLEQLVNDVEFARVQADVIYGLKQGTDVLKMMNKEIGGIEAVDQLLGEAEEARAYTKVRIRLIWRIKQKSKADGVIVGGQRNASWSHVQPGGRRGRGRVRGIGEGSQRSQNSPEYRGINSTECTNIRTSAARVTEREMGEESEGTTGGIDSRIVSSEWDRQTLVEAIG